MREIENSDHKAPRMIFALTHSLLSFFKGLTAIQTRPEFPGRVFCFNGRFALTMKFISKTDIGR